MLCDLDFCARCGGWAHARAGVPGSGPQWLPSTHTAPRFVSLIFFGSLPRSQPQFLRAVQAPGRQAHCPGLPLGCPHLPPWPGALVSILDEPNCMWAPSVSAPGPQICQADACLGAFAPAVPSAWLVLGPHVPLAGSVTCSGSLLIPNQHGFLLSRSPPRTCLSVSCLSLLLQRKELAHRCPWQ